MPEGFRVCRITEVWKDKCCFGACIDLATHSAVVLDSKGDRTQHLRCPAHLAWSREREQVESVQTLEVTSP